MHERSHRERRRGRCSREGVRSSQAGVSERQISGCSGRRVAGEDSTNSNLKRHRKPLMLEGRFTAGDSFS